MPRLGLPPGGVQAGEAWMRFAEVADMIPAPARLLLLPYELQPFRFDVLDFLHDLRVDLRCSSATGPRTPVQAMPTQASRSAAPWSVPSPALGLTWTGFSSEGLADLFRILKLSLSFGVMLCLEVWYSTILVLLAGHLKNPEVALDALPICLNINGRELMMPDCIASGVADPAVRPYTTACKCPAAKLPSPDICSPVHCQYHQVQVHRSSEGGLLVLSEDYEGLPKRPEYYTVYLKVCWPSSSACVAG